MLSFFLAAFVHLAILGGGGFAAHPASVAPPASHLHMHIMDSTGGPAD
jgi:hypothetical protein